MSDEPLIPETRDDEMLHVNLRDVSATSPDTLLPNRLFRCSGVFNALTIQHFGIKSIVDLRRESASPVVETIKTSEGEMEIPRSHVSLVSSSVAFGLWRKLKWYKKLQLMCCFSMADGIFASAIMKTPTKMAEFYVLILENSYDEMKRVMTHFVEPSNYPVIVHCIAGKDRTGIVIAILLSLCGVDNDSIVNDYAESQGNLHSASVAGLLGDHSLLEENHIKSPPAAMKLMLEMLEDEYGSAYDYLLEIGLSEEQVESIRDNLMKDED